MKNVLLVASITLASLFSSVANANIVSVSTILEESQNGNYITDKTTYVDWLKFDSSSRAAELVDGHNWHVASIDLVREMVESVAQGRDIQRGVYTYGSNGSERLTYLSQMSQSFGPNYESYWYYSGSPWRGDMTTGYVTNESDYDGVSYVTFGAEWATCGSNCAVAIGNYIESSSKLTYRDNNGSIINYESQAFMYRVNQEGYRAGLVSGILRDVSSPLMGGLGLMALGLFGMRRRSSASH